jgi:hypothetical protein
MFTTLKENREQVHSKEFCEICDYVGHIKNIKRHIKTVHKGLTPASAARIKKEKKKPKFKCTQCEEKNSMTRVL